MNLGRNLIYATILFILLNNCSKSPTEPNPVSSGTILFIHGNDTVNQICTMNPDGSDIKVIAAALQPTYLPTKYDWAKVSPKGDLLVVQGGIRESLAYDPLYIMDTEGNILYKLTWNGYRPFWMNDGEHVLFTRRRGPFSLTYDVYKINIHSRAEEMIMESEYEPSGSNSYYEYIVLDVQSNMDSKLLLLEFLVTEDSSGMSHTHDPEILFYDIIAQTKTYLTNNEKWEGPARISPDGTQIAYGISHSLRAHVHYQIHMMTIDGDSLDWVTTESEVTGHHYYTWSPDGNYLAYTKADQSVKSYNEYNDIYIMNINTREEKQITFSGSESNLYYVMEWR